MEELDLKKIFDLFWEKKFFIIAVVIIFAMLGVIYTIGFVTPEYKSSTRMVLTQATDSSSTEESSGTITSTDLTLNSKLIATYSELITSNQVLEEVVSNLGIEGLEASDIKQNVSITNVEDSDVIEITVTNENPVVAAQIADEVAEVFIQKIAAEIYNINNVHIVDEAKVSETPYNVNHVRDILIFVVIGMVIAVAYILIVSILDTTIKSAEDIEKAVGLPVLASIPVYEFDSDKGGKR